MKVTAFIRKTAKKNDTDSMATIYFRLRDGKKDIKAASELVINPNHWSMERPLYFDPFGQIEFAHFGHNMIDPCKVLVQGSILFYPFRYSSLS